jgi:hypothetical protein
VSLGHVHPAVHYTAPSSFNNVTNPVYMVSTVVPPSATYKVWRVRNVATGTPLVDVKTLDAINLYDMPVAALQPYPGPALDTNDVRIMQAVALGDTLWATHVTNCLQLSGINKPCIRVVKVFVGDSGGTLTAAFQHDVTFASLETDANLAYFMPGLAVNSSQNTAISFLASSPTMYQGAAWTWKSGIDQLYAPATVFAAGSCIRASGKIGDYVGAQTNPNDLVSLWLAGEAAAPSGQGCNWRTQILQVTP